MTEEIKQKIIEKLRPKIAQAKCPMCGYGQFTLIDGFQLLSYQDQTKSIEIPGKSTMPTVSVVCNNCGYVSIHALGALGLLKIGDTDNS